MKSYEHRMWVTINNMGGCWYPNLTDIKLCLVPMQYSFPRQHWQNGCAYSWIHTHEQCSLASVGPTQARTKLGAHIPSYFPSTCIQVEGKYEGLRVCKEYISCWTKCLTQDTIMWRYCSLMKEYLWAEHLTSLSMTGVDACLSESAFHHKGAPM